MDKLPARGLNRMCRLCLCSDVSLIEIFTLSSELNSVIADVIAECVSVPIQSNDELPDKICRACYDQLVKTQQFRTQAAQSDKALRHYLKHLLINNEKIKSEINSIHSDADYSINDGTNPLRSSIEGNSVTIRDNSCEETNNYLTNKTIHHEETEFCIPNTKIKLGLPYTTSSKCKETKIDLANRKVDVLVSKPQVVWITEKTSSDIEFEKPEVDFLESRMSILDSNLHAGNDDRLDEGFVSNIDLNLKCEIDDSFENKINIKQENEIPDTTIASMLNENTNDSLNDDDKNNRSATQSLSYQCNICKKCFRNSSNLKKHKLIHNGQKPYLCDVCYKSFTQSCNLKKHMFIHTGEKPYQCKTCDKSFADPSSLNRHTFTHSHKKPYHCDVCNKGFTNPSTVKKHKLTHTGVKPYQCDVCEKSFAYSWNLKVHYVTHTNERPYQCDVCNKCYTQGNKLKMHKRKHAQS